MLGDVIGYPIHLHRLRYSSRRHFIQSCISDSIHPIALVVPPAPRIIDLGNLSSEMR